MSATDYNFYYPSQNFSVIVIVSVIVKSGLLNWALKSSSFEILSLWVLMLVCSFIFSPVLCHLLKPGSLLNKDVDDLANKTHDKQNTESILLLQTRKGYRLVHKDLAFCLFNIYELKNSIFHGSQLIFVYKSHTIGYYIAIFDQALDFLY